MHLVKCHFLKCTTSLTGALAREITASHQTKWFCSGHTCVTAHCSDAVVEVRDGVDILYWAEHTCVVDGCWKEVRALLADGKQADGKHCENHREST